MSGKPFGFELQPPKGGFCGVYAFAHAMLLIGQTGTLEDYIRMTDYISISNSLKENVELMDLLSIKSALSKISLGYGTTGDGILKAIKKTGCGYVKIDQGSEQHSKEILDKYSVEGYPVILFANWDKTASDQGHWFLCAGRKENKYLIVDSSPKSTDKNFFSFYSWEELSRRLVFYSADVRYFQLMGFALKPSNGISATPKICSSADKLNNDAEFAKAWGNYAKDLFSVFDSSKSSADRLSSKDFFNKYSPEFIKAITQEIDNNTARKIKEELLNYRYISDIYNLSVSNSKLDKALITFTTLLIKKIQTK
jgi:hypothetical protein